jgi:hypothetical protein
MDWVKVWRAVGGRKFIAFAVACLFLVLKLISQEIWVTAFTAYVAGNVAQKVFTKGGGYDVE